MSEKLRHKKLTGWVVGLMLLIGLLSCLLQLWAEGRHLRHPDAVFYAQVARNILQTGYFSTSVITQQYLVGAPPPVDLNRPWPVRGCSVGYPLLLAGLFLLFGIGDYVCYLVSIATFLGLIVAVSYFARDLGWR